MKQTPAPPVALRLSDGLTAELLRKPIRRLYLRVLPPEGRIVITVPLAVTEGEARRFAEGKLSWLEEKRGELLLRAAEAADVSSLPLWGQRLAVTPRHCPGKPVLLRAGEGLILCAGGEVSPEEFRTAAAALYRRELLAAVPPLLGKYQPLMGVQSAEWRLRDMRSRWGSCHVQARRVTLNLRLAAYPPLCLESVVVHELAHLLEKGHNAAFYAWMDRFYPNWPAARRRLRLPPAGD